MATPVPYTPTVLASPIVNPAIGSQGIPPIPYLSNSMYKYAPTAIDAANLKPGGSATDQAQVLADTLLRATYGVDSWCFGADAGPAASLAASLSVESMTTKIKNGELRLVCDYKPIQQVIGIDVGPNPANLSSIGPSLASSASIGRRTIVVPLYGVPVRPGDTGSPIVPTPAYGTLYAVWSYVCGYPHTQLAASVTQGATSCIVQATDGNGGVWGIIPGHTYLTVYDTANTERILVTGVTPGTNTCTLTTSQFANAHTLPTAPDFIPVTAISPDIQQAVISYATMLIKTRGARALVMPSTAGGAPSQQTLAQAGATGDWANVVRLLAPYKIRTKSKV